MKAFRPLNVFGAVELPILLLRRSEESTPIKILVHTSVTAEIRKRKVVGAGTLTQDLRTPCEVLRRTLTNAEVVQNFNSFAVPIVCIEGLDDSFTPSNSDRNEFSIPPSGVSRGIASKKISKFQGLIDTAQASQLFAVNSKKKKVLESNELSNEE